MITFTLEGSGQPLYLRAEYIVAITGAAGTPAHVYVLGSDDPFVLAEDCVTATDSWYHALEALGIPVSI